MPSDKFPQNSPEKLSALEEVCNLPLTEDKKYFQRLYAGIRGNLESVVVNDQSVIRQFKAFADSIRKSTDPQPAELKLIKNSVERSIKLESPNSELFKKALEELEQN